MSVRNALAARGRPAASRARKLHLHRGFTLVEVMVSVVIFALLSLGLTAIFLQNLRYTREQAYRTQALTTASSILEQIRILRYPNIQPISDDPSKNSFAVKISDPNYTPPPPDLPDGYKPVQLQVNVNNGTEIQKEWNILNNVLMDTAPNAPTLHMEIWLTLNKVSATDVNRHEAFEIVLLYRWRPTGASASTNKVDNMRVLIPRSIPVAS